MNKKSIKSLSLNEVNLWFEQHNQPKFRVNQLLEWLYKKNVDDFSLMTNIPNEIIQELSSNFVISNPTISDKLFSKDGTIKYVLSFNNKSNKEKVECVAIPQSSKDDNFTLCISCQIGCPMGCMFCATGKQGFSRNLTYAEIMDQIKFVIDDLNCTISNIVFMGQGEPFQNYQNVNDALLFINSDKFFNIGARKITVSTCGIIPGIKKFTKIQCQFVLAISLHSAIQKTRNILMPNVKSYSLNKLKESLLEYQKKTNRRITFEYLLIDNINSDQEHLNALIAYSKNLKVHINLINYNIIKESDFAGVNKQKLLLWKQTLNSNGIETTIRDSKGSDIAAACGQLINKSK